MPKAEQIIDALVRGKQLVFLTGTMTLRLRNDVVLRIEPREDEAA